MALLNFLYKNESILSSLTAQIFHGKTIKIDTEKKSTDTSNYGVKVDCKLLGWNTGASKGGEERFVETIDPHDEAILNTLTHLQQYCVDEKEIDENKLVFLSGKIVFIPFEQRRFIIDIGFEQIKQNNPTNLPKNQREKFFELSKNACLGSQDESTFYFKSKGGKVYWGSLERRALASFVNSLQISYGINPIPVLLFAKCAGKYNTDINIADDLILTQRMQNMASLANKIVCGNLDIDYTLIPLAIMQPIDAEPLNQDVEAPGE